jgi:hypothetical protein
MLLSFFFFQNVLPPSFLLFSCILEKGASKIPVLFKFFSHDTHQVSPEIKGKKVKQVFFMLYKAHKDCGQAQDRLIKRRKLVL